MIDHLNAFVSGFLLGAATATFAVGILAGVVARHQDDILKFITERLER